MDGFKRISLLLLSCSSPTQSKSGTVESHAVKLIHFLVRIGNEAQSRVLGWMFTLLWHVYTEKQPELFNNLVWNIKHWSVLKYFTLSCNTEVFFFSSCFKYNFFLFSSLNFLHYYMLYQDTITGYKFQLFTTMFEKNSIQENRQKIEWKCPTLLF